MREDTVINTNGQIAIYQTEDGQTQIDVRMEKDTLWLTLLQMAELFDRDKSVISRHLKNIFDTGELPREATVAKSATVQIEGGRHVSREIEYFNLDAVISVGYRVNSIKGTQFRIWATQRLREYLVQGYTLNQSRFDQNAAELQQALALIRKAARSPELSSEAGSGLVEIVSRYTQTFLWLQRYDEGMLAEPAGQSRPVGVRRTGLSHSGEQGRAPAIFRGKEPSVFGRQQAQRGFAVCGFPASQRTVAERAGRGGD